MTQALIAVLSLFLAIFLTGAQIHAGQCQGLAQEGTWVDGRDEDGNATLMHSVSSPKFVKDVPKLLPEGAVASGTNVTYESALFNASRAGNGNTVKLRAKAGASPDMPGGTGGTALIAVPDNRHVRIVWALRLPVAPPSLDSQKMESSTEAGQILSRRGACRMIAAIQAMSRGPPQYETRTPLSAGRRWLGTELMVTPGDARSLSACGYLDCPPPACGSSFGKTCTCKAIRRR